MKKRVVATALWFYAGWVTGSVLAFFLSVNPILAPIVATAGAALIGWDPRGVIWGNAGEDARVKALARMPHPDAELTSV